MYVDEFRGMPHRRHNPMDPPSPIWLVAATGAVGLFAFLIMIIGFMGLG